MLMNVGEGKKEIGRSLLGEVRGVEMDKQGRIETSKRCGYYKVLPRIT